MVVVARHLAVSMVAAGFGSTDAPSSRVSMPPLKTSGQKA